jgi:hypothetical protein
MKHAKNWAIALAGLLACGDNSGTPTDAARGDGRPGDAAAIDALTTDARSTDGASVVDAGGEVDAGADATSGDDASVDGSTPDAGVNPVCVGAMDAFLGDNVGDTTGGASDASVHGCFVSTGPEHIWSFTPGQSGTLRLTLTDTTKSGENDQVLYVRADCTQPTSELGCRDDGVQGTGEILDVVVTAGNPISIFVDGYITTEFGPYILNLAML